MLRLPKTLKLDYKKWRCGSNSRSRNKRVGRGHTDLLNKQGYMCCLGQFCTQAGVDKKCLLSVAMPSYLSNLSAKNAVSSLTYKTTDNVFYNTEISNHAADINDDIDTTIIEKVKLLRELFAKEGRKIRLVNFPKCILKQIRSKKTSAACGSSN